jgi:16S rRNA processing protein RimM
LTSKHRDPSRPGLRSLPGPTGGSPSEAALSPSAPLAGPPAEAAEQTAPSWLLLARILRPQGRKGEVLADLFTDFPERFEGEPRVFLARPGFNGPGPQARAVQVLGFFLPVGKNQGRIVLHLAGITSINDAETLSGLEIVVPLEERLAPEEDAQYISDLLGCSVYDAPSLDAQPTLIGVIDDVHIPTTPDGTRPLEDAAPLLAVLSPANEEILIPFVKAYLLLLDPAAKRIVMHLPAGLVEVNSPTK